MKYTQPSLVLIGLHDFLIFTSRTAPAWCVEAGNICSVSVFFVLVGSQISPRRAKKDSNIPSPGRTRSVKCPIPGKTKTIKSPPRALSPLSPAGFTLIGALSCLKSNQFAPQIKSCSKWQSCQKVAPNSKSFQKVSEQLVAKASPFKAVEGRKYGHETSKFLRWIKNQSFLAMGLRSSAWNSAILFFGVWLRLMHCPVIVG